MGSVPGSSMSGAGAAFNAVADVLGGFAQQGAYDAQAQIARNNAIIARQNASYAAQSGEAKSEQLGLRNRGQVAEIASRQAGAGIDPNSGSALDVRKSSGMLGNLDVLSARSAAARQAYGYQLDAATQDMNERQARKAGKIAPWLGGIDALGSLLGASVSLQGMYAQAQKEGVSTNGGLPLDEIFGSGGSSGAGPSGTNASDYEGMFD